MHTNDERTTLHELKQKVATFRDERDWAKHHTPKNLAISIAIEAAELMELFQWDDYSKRDQQKIEEELADILIYCFNLAESCQIDISSAFIAKLKAAEKKYPKELFNKDTDSPDQYYKIKQSYRRNNQ